MTGTRTVPTTVTRKDARQRWSCNHHAAVKNSLATITIVFMLHGIATAILTVLMALTRRTAT